jgi:peptidoglycan/LPS O-acetylase OafA/YrhL
MPASYVLAYLFLVGNWMTVVHGPPASPMLVLWSVAVEEQFYIVWPVAVRSLTRRGIATIALGLLAVASATRWWLASGTTVNPHAIGTNTLARLDPFAAGMLLAVVLRGRMPNLTGWQRLRLLLGGSALWLLVSYNSSLTLHFYLLGYPGIAVGAVALFLAIAGSKFFPRPFPYLGKISYGLYIFHLAVLTVLVRYWGRHLYSIRGFVAYALTGFALTLLVAGISYRWLETPFLKLKARFALVASRPV